MGTTRYTEGGVTVTLDGALEALVRRALDAAAGETVRVMEEAAQEVADKARAAWYTPGTGVRRVTGKSGDIQVVTTVSESRVMVSVGTTDQRRVGAAGKALAYVLRRSSRLASDAEPITEAEYYAARKSGRKSSVFRARKSEPSHGIARGKCYRIIHSIYASDSRSMFVELVQRPMKSKIKIATPVIAADIAARMGR